MANIIDPPVTAWKEDNRPVKEVVVENPQGVRYDVGKPQFDLLPVFGMTELAMVYTKGAVKYARFNFLKGMNYSRIIGSGLRHTIAWLAGEDRDPETGLHHMAHVAWNALAIVEYDYQKVGTDDRYKVSPESMAILQKMLKGIFEEEHGEDGTSGTGN